MNLAPYRLILASGSPRRQQLLQELGLEFEIRLKNIEETYPENLPVWDVPAFLARKKAHAFQSELQENELLIASDTVVIHENKILGKPENEPHALAMLRALSGKKHTVVSGITLLTSTQELTESDHTEVYFLELEEIEIEEYIQKFQPLDKAGAYGIQEMLGMIGIEKIKGSYFNVMGLPTHLLWKMLKKFSSNS